MLHEIVAPKDHLNSARLKQMRRVERRIVAFNFPVMRTTPAVMAARRVTAAEAYAAAAMLDSVWWISNDRLNPVERRQYLTTIPEIERGITDVFDAAQKLLAIGWRLNWRRA